MVQITRRGLLGSLLAAPAVIVAERLMPVKLWTPELVKPRLTMVPMYISQGWGDGPNILVGWANDLGFTPNERFFQLTAAEQSVVESDSLRSYRHLMTLEG